jgi:hypothetical protein
MDNFCSSGTLAFHRLVPFDSPDFVVDADGNNFLVLGHRGRALVIEAAEILTLVAQEIGSPTEDGWEDDDGGAESTLRLATDALAYCRGPLDCLESDAHHTFERRRTAYVRSRIARILDGSNLPFKLVDDIDHMSRTTRGARSPKAAADAFFSDTNFRAHARPFLRMAPPPVPLHVPLQAPRPISGIPAFASRMVQQH